jgi:hypothetical protein
MTDAYAAVVGDTDPCPDCGHVCRQEAAVRVTETTEAAAKPDVEYADPGLQEDGKPRLPLNNEARVRKAWDWINQARNATHYSPADWKKIKARVKAAMKRLDIAVSENSTEAVINGQRSWDELRDLVRRAIRARIEAGTNGYCWVYIVDISDTDVVFTADDDTLWQAPWSIDGDTVAVDEPVQVVRTYAPVEADDESEGAATESEERARVDIDGARILEAKGEASDGGRIFRVQIIAYGDSKNGRRYPESVMRAAASLYEGAKAFDHHRTAEEMSTGTIQGLIGYYRNASAGANGVEADLHLLPSATQAAEALDAALSQESAEPLVGISHDVYAKFRSIQESGRSIQEATEITSVNSADVVSHPAAGGKATRVVAGGIDTPQDRASEGQSTKETDVALSREDVLAAFKEATAEELAAVGLTRAGTPTIEATETAKPEQVTETTVAKASILGRLTIKAKVEDAQLPAAAIESITTMLPDRISESDVDTQIGIYKGALTGLERAGLVPQLAKVEVTQEAHDKKVTALDAFFAGDYSKGYPSFREAFMDFTGRAPRSLDGDFNRVIVSESIRPYDSGVRAHESLDTGSWAQALGDSITRRMVALYGQPGLQSWRSIVSSTVPVNDFRTQRIQRVGGHGLLPTVNQGAPYQPLTSPGNEEVTYALAKKGGTEDITLEMIANDDVRAIQQIPAKLGLAAAQTLFRFVWDFFDTNATIYDGKALFHADHANAGSTALSQSALTAARAAMRSQAAYGDSSNILSLVPKKLIVVNDLEELAFQLSTSAVAVPSTPAGPSDTPNIHKNMETIVVDYWASTTKWLLVADPALCPTFELGFYRGQELPELFTQSDPNTGSTFNADKVTYKVRHIYSGAVLDYRGFYRGNS